MRLAVLEDDPAMREVLCEWLAAAGYAVHEFATGRDCMRILARESFDLCLLDLSLPDVRGAEVLRWMREDRGDLTPVMFVTASDSEADIVTALRAGADDYLIKPVRRAELLARMEAVLRRVQPVAADRRLEVGPYAFDPEHKRAQLDGVPLELTEMEFDLALFLFRNIGRLLSRGHLLEAVWGRSAAVATRTVDTHISRVRSKLQLRPERGFRLTPTYSYGYRLERIDA